MSVQGCYTDFHIDFGGTSVWYHILWGCKVREHYKYTIVQKFGVRKNLKIFLECIMLTKAAFIWYLHLVI